MIKTIIDVFIFLMIIFMNHNSLMPVHISSSDNLGVSGSILADTLANKDIQELKKTIAELTDIKIEIKTKIEQYIKEYKFRFRDELSEILFLDAKVGEELLKRSDKFDYDGTNIGIMERILKQEITEEEKDVLKKIYRFLAMRYHPDRINSRTNLTAEEKKGKEELFKEIKEKYEQNDIEYLRQHAKENFGDEFSESKFYVGNEKYTNINNIVETLTAQLKSLMLDIERLKNSKEYKDYLDSEKDSESLWEKKKEEIEAQKKVLLELIKFFEEKEEKEKI